MKKSKTLTKGQLVAAAAHFMDEAICRLTGTQPPAEAALWEVDGEQVKRIVLQALRKASVNQLGLRRESPLRCRYEDK